MQSTDGDSLILNFPGFSREAFASWQFRIGQFEHGDSCVARCKYIPNQFSYAIPIEAIESAAYSWHGLLFDFELVA
jgi:hypothetical protein